MKFALIDNNRVEAKSGLIAICPGCSKSVIPKCGEQRVHHWAHSRGKMCDSWWESETEWHRNWKSKFPIEWQEGFLVDDKTGEMHIADIRTDKGLVIEFQHSHINLLERSSRESFYRDLSWVVDGTRLKRDYPRFLKGKESFRTIKKGIYSVIDPEECFPSSWLESSVPVLFDFNDTYSQLINHSKQHLLYCLFPVRVDRNAIVAEITVNAFVNKVISGEWTTRTRQFISDIIQVDKEMREQYEGQKRIEENLMFRKFMGLNRGRRSRQF
ncbi:MAG: competence protein [Bacteroidetes bacterium]|nr:MAG: competence protein [Bacteroidota bacterium]